MEHTSQENEREDPLGDALSGRYILLESLTPISKRERKSGELEIVKMIILSFFYIILSFSYK